MPKLSAQKPIKSAVIVSKVYKRPVSGAIREIASILNELGVDVCLDSNTSIGFTYFVNSRNFQTSNA